MMRARWSIAWDKGKARSEPAPLDDVPVELLGPLAGQSVGDLFDVLVTTSGKALRGGKQQSVNVVLCLARKTKEPDSP